MDSIRNQRRWKNRSVTDQSHNCPKKKNGHTLQTTTEATTAIVAEPNTLKFAESLLELISDYIRLKTKELEIAGATK